MRCLAHIALVTVIQFIACYLADWGNAETVFMLFFIVLWQGLFIWLFSQIRKKRNVSDEFKFSKGVWYITMPVSSLLSPLLSLMVFIIGTLYELRRVSGCVSVREWMQSQVNEQTNEDLLWILIIWIFIVLILQQGYLCQVLVWISVVIHMVIVQNDMMSES